MARPPSQRSGLEVDTKTGLIAAFGAFGLWGFFPLYFWPLHPIGADIIICHRLLWSLIFVGFYLGIVGRTQEVIDILVQPKRLFALAVSGAVILINWFLFVWAIEVGRVLEVSFGYFINPLVSILLGMLLLGERLNRWQTTAVMIAAVAVAAQAIALGALPWLSLVLAFSFGTYGYMRKKIPVRPIPALFIETTLTTPLAVAYLIWKASAGINVFPVFGDPIVTALLVGSGAITALTLILFATGARGLPLSTIGMLQYITPSLHFLIAVFIFVEPLDWFGLSTFALIWASLAIYTIDLVRRHQRGQEHASAAT